MTDTVTISRVDYDAMQERLQAYEALLEELQDARDLAAAAERRNDETIPFEMTERMLDGESPVRVWREHRGLTARSVAQKAGLSSPMMTAIETGKRIPSLPMARAIAAALDVGLDDLFLDASPSNEEGS